MSNTNLMMLTDGYKLDHRRQYPEDTRFVYSNFTARGSRIEGQEDTIAFGLQYFLKKYLMEFANESFFSKDKTKVIEDYQRFLDSYIGPNDVGTGHISALHDLGYIPLEFCAVSEGTRVPLRMPMFTVENTHPDFFWVTNYFETLISNTMWLPITSATTSNRYRKILDSAANMTSSIPGFVDWQAHDFSMRGMSNSEASALSGAGHLLSFTGTDTLPAIQLLADYYSATGLIGGSVPATEHSVMCAGGQEDELETFRRLLKLYPKGIVSVVSDTWDLWHVVDVILPQLKDEIMARDGKLVIRPDSGDPADILCGSINGETETERKGLIRRLYDIFGGTKNNKGFIELDPHIGAIYGDSITTSRATDIADRLAGNGFASTNVVLGIGSYTYQYVTRDTHMMAMKATWADVGGKERFLFKNPKTDSGMKKSAKGRIVLRNRVNGFTGIQMIDGLTKDQQASYTHENLLKPVWSDGKFIREENLADIRARVKVGI